MTFHMSVTKREAEFLKSILAKHLDDYVEELAREDKDNTTMMAHLQANRKDGLSLMEKAGEVKRRASRMGDTPYFTNLSQCAIVTLCPLHYYTMFENEEVLDKVTVDIQSRRFTLLSSEGSVKTVECDDGDQFIRILDVVRESCTDEVVYV